MTEWKKNACVLCAQNHGLEFKVEDNRLTKNTHRDPLGTPLDRFVPCRIETADG